MSVLVVRRIAQSILASVTIAGTMLVGATDASADSAGTCLGGYAYVLALSATVGIPSYRCLVPTDCNSDVTVGPNYMVVGPVTEGHEVNVPLPSNSDPLTCYL